MKKRKLLLVLSSLTAVAAVSTTAINFSKADSGITTGIPQSNELDKRVDSHDNLVSEVRYASPSVEVEYDFEKELEGLEQDTPVHKGTKDDPMDVYTAFNLTGAGDTLILLNGTYKTTERITLAHSGNAKRLIKVQAETPGQVHFDFSDQEFGVRGVQLNGNYWQWYGVDIYGSGDNGMYIAGSNNKIERCTFHENSDTGLQLGRSASSITDISGWPSNNLILNCTSYNNYDKETLGENADGFAAKLTVGDGNVFDGCIAYRNSDDGWDMYAKTDSGNIGTITLLNCVAFENGWVLEKTNSYTKDKDGNYMDSFMTQNGDGNGFKLGGSIMNGEMVLKNCMAFNNRMGGFADNSNPGVLSLYNCTSYNNSVYMSMTSKATGEIDQTGETGVFGANDGDSENFAMARTEASYNTFYGCLSYVSNMTNTDVAYGNFDEYRGAASYSIFYTGRDSYTQITDPIDASSYESAKKGSKYNGTINDSTFKAVSLGVEITGNRTVDTDYRNADGSINMGDMLVLTDSTLKTFCNGKAIGCELNKTLMSDYEHVDWANLEGVSTSKDYTYALRGLEALTLPCNENYVFQDINLISKINGISVSWYSSNEDVLSIGYYQVESNSNRDYIIGNIKRSRTADQEVDLVATVSSGSVTLSKTFHLVVKKEVASVGTVTGFDSKYIVSQYAVWNDPEIIVTDKASYSGNALVAGTDYNLELSYEYAENTSSKFYKVDKVYTTVAGVYKVSYDVVSLLGDGYELTGSYLVYVLSETAAIDLSQNAELAAKYGISQTNGADFMVNASRDGAKVSAVFNATYGYMYILTSNNEVETVETIVANGTKVAINDEYAEGIAPNDNVAKYYVHVVVGNRTNIASKQLFSQVYTTTVETKDVASEEEFYNLITGESLSNTIYLLTRDLDFSTSTYEWTKSTSGFAGLLNGKGFTIKNITIESQSADKGANVIYKLSNGTIMNVKFDNISITATNSSDQATGIIGQMNGGYIHNVSLSNISVLGKSGVGGLVGQVTGQVNYVTNVSLVNPMEKGHISGNKYIGGLIGNMQKTTDQAKVELYVSNCFVNAYIGDHQDQGYIGGIVGRNKNEFNTYVLSVDHSYFSGVVDTNYTYSGGIVGSIDSSAGYVTLMYNVSDALLILKDTRLDKASTEIGQKNNSPIVGRFTYVEELCHCGGNFGPYSDSHSEIGSDADDFETNIASQAFWTRIGFTEDRGWTFTENSPFCVLTNSISNN